MRLLFAQYKLTYEYWRERYPLPIGRNYLGVSRQVNIETQLLSMGGLYSIMSIEATANRTKSAYYILATFNKIRLTQSSVKDPKRIVRRSRFRESLAAQSLAVDPQMRLAFYGYENVIDISKPLFAMLIHGPDRRDASRPAFAYIVFPDNTYRVYAHVINLFERFQTLVRELTAPPTSEEQEETPLSVDPSKRRRSKGKRNTP